MLGREVLSSPSMARIKIAQAVGGVGRLVSVPIRMTSVDNVFAVCRIPGNLGTSGDSALMSEAGKGDAREGFKRSV